MATVKRKKTPSGIAGKVTRSKVVEAKLALNTEADNERKARQRDGKVGLGAFTSFLDSAMAFSQKYDNLLELELVRDVPDQWGDRVQIGVSIKRTMNKHRYTIEGSGLATLPDTNSRLSERFVIGIGSNIDLLSLVKNELKSYKEAILRQWLDTCARTRILRKMSDEERRIMGSAAWIEPIAINATSGVRDLIAYTLGAEDTSELEDEHDLVEDLEFTPDMLRDLRRRISQHWAISPTKLEKSPARVVVQYEQMVEKLYLRP